MSKSKLVCLFVVLCILQLTVESFADKGGYGGPGGPGGSDGGVGAGAGAGGKVGQTFKTPFGEFGAETSAGANVGGGAQG